MPDNEHSQIDTPQVEVHPEPPALPADEHLAASPHPEPAPPSPSPEAADHHAEEVADEPANLEAGEEEVPAETAAEDTEAAPADEAAPAPPAEPNNKRWYVVKVQTGREESIRDAIERRVKIEGLEEYYGQIVIPVERVTEMRHSKRVTKERKLYPGYLMVEVEYNDRILYLFRETSGVGDFVGGTVNRPPPPMSEREVERMIGASKVSPEDATKVVHAKPKFGKGDRVKVTDGTFAGMTGEVKELHEAEGTVSVELRIFDRPVDVKMEYWQVEIA